MKQYSDFYRLYMLYTADWLQTALKDITLGEYNS